MIYVIENNYKTCQMVTLKDLRIVTISYIKLMNVL